MVADKPLVSFMVVTYNQERFIREAIQSAFAQTYEPMEIILSDDCSPDNTYEILCEEAASYRGPHTVRLNRNEKNLGLAGNLNRVLELAGGKYIVAMAGDDISLPERTSELVGRLMDEEAPVDMVCSYCEKIDEHSRSKGFIKKDVLFVPNITKSVYKWTCGASGACVAYNRKLFDKYGPLDTRIIAEDWVLSFRAWAESGIALIEKPLLLHRTHGQNISVLSRTIKEDPDPQRRRFRRLQAVGDCYARVIDWQRVLKISGKETRPDVERELNNWIRLLEMEWESYHSGPSHSLQLSFKALRYPNGIRSAMRIFVRNVLGLH